MDGGASMEERDEYLRVFSKTSVVRKKDTSSTMNMQGSKGSALERKR
jgi:hypothetical protein